MISIANYDFQPAKVVSEHDEVLVVTGPTCSGKTDYALELCEKDSSIEIVNGDSALIYRGFDIGTAKPLKQILGRTPHHLIDILDPSEFFSAGEYSRLAREVIRTIRNRGKRPVVVGGTAFYLDALFSGIMQVDIDPDEMETAKMRIKEEIAVEGFDEMHERLREIDPILYAQIQRERNPLRLMRAWEHYYATGQSLGEARQTKKDAFELSPVFHVFDIPRQELWKRIEARVDSMLKQGWLAEAERLEASGVTREMPAMGAIGYREMFDVLDGVLSLEDARNRIIIRTRQYAKRQVTWMKKYQVTST